MKSFVLLVASVVLLARSACGYGNAGHQAVGTMAEHYLEGTRAGREVRTLLHAKEDMARAATWADRAKLPEKYLSAEMKEYVANNPGHRSYHYCDLPFQEKAYREGMTGTNPSDIVQTLRKCIEVLQSPEANPENPLKINKRVALMLVAHLMGDLHQPLHVGSSYIDEDNQFVNPETGAKGQMDAGANYLRLTSRTNLHGFWDTKTVKLARDKAGAEDFTRYLLSHFPKKAEWDGQGAPTTWPEQWATDTLRSSPSAFKGIAPGNRITVPKDEKHDEHFAWTIKLPPDYNERTRVIVELELAKAGYRLAALLQAIWPEDKNPKM